MLLRTITAVSFLLSAVLFFWLDTALWLVPVLFAGFWLALLLLAFLFLCCLSGAVDMEKP